MAAPLFRPHGHFELRQERGVFVLDAEGPWNRETFDAYVASLRTRTGIRPERWGAYCTVRGEALVAPDLVPQWRDSNAMLARSGLVAVAYHFADPRFARFYEIVFREAIGEAPFEVVFVDGEAQAMAWLAERKLVSD